MKKGKTDIVNVSLIALAVVLIGVLVYSVCSLEPEEGEEVIQFLLDNTDAKIEKPDMQIKSGVNLSFNNKVYSKEINKCIKLWPQYYDTEGFFIAKIRKP